MAQQVEQWSIEKVLVCLKRIVHQDVLPSISQEELDRFDYRIVFKEREKVLDFLKFVYKKSNGKLEIYGSVDEMIEGIRKIDKIPEFIKFSPSSEVEVSSTCAYLTMGTGYHETIGSDVYLSRSDVAIKAYKLVTSLVKLFGMNELTMEIFFAWQITHLNNTLNGFKGSYDFPPSNFRQLFLDDISSFINSKPNIKVPKEPVTIESFSKLKAYFDPKYEKVSNEILNPLKIEMIDGSKQEYYKETYAQVLFLLENIKRIYDRYSELFIPSSALKRTPSMNHKPVIRFFENHAVEFLLSSELKNAMQRLMMKNMSDEQWKDLIVVESEEERKNGIVYATHPNEFKKLLKELNWDHDKFAIIRIHLEEDYQSMSLPIISSYGTHCIPVLEAFCRIVYYLTVILKVFLRCSVENIQKVFKWIDDVIDSLSVEKSVFYLIELWRFNEIIDRARKDLSPFLTEPEYEVPYQPQYNKNEVFREFEKMLKNIGWEKQHFLKTTNLLLSLLSRSTITIKNVYTVYSQMVRLYLQEYRPKVISFIISQSMFAKRYKTNDELPDSKPEPERETLTGVKEGCSNKQESSQKEKIQEPSCSTENNEDRIEKKPLKTKTANKSSEKKNRKKLEKFVRSQKLKAELEKSTELNTITSFEEQIQKTRENLEKLREENSQLEEDMMTQELSDLVETINVKEIHEENDSEFPTLLKKDLESTKVKNNDLKSEPETPENDPEDLKQNVEFLMSENEELRTQNLKITEFKQRVKEQVNSIFSRLNRVCFTYPESRNLEKSMTDLIILKDYLDEYK